MVITMNKMNNCNCMNSMNNMNGCSYGNANNASPCRKDRHAMLNMLRAEDFVVYEAALYLNCHPCDKEALEYFKCHRDTAAKLRQEYEAAFGPLTINAVNCDDWSWINHPWPWEKEAN